MGYFHRYANCLKLYENYLANFLKNFFPNQVDEIDLRSAFIDG